MVQLTAPTLVSVTRAEPASSPTDADSLMWTFEFSEVVSAPVLSDFTVTGTTAAVTYIGDAGGPGPAQSYGVTILGGDLADLNGTVSLTLNNPNQVRDLAGNAMTNVSSTGANDNNFVIDNAAPTVSASMPPAAVNGPFDVEFSFSEDVEGFEPSDFNVENATVEIKGGPRIFTVTITPDGNGDVSVELPANTTLVVVHVNSIGLPASHTGGVISSVTITSHVLVQPLGLVTSNV